MSGVPPRAVCSLALFSSIPLTPAHWIAGLLLAFPEAAFANAAVSGRLEYTRDVRPILADNCLNCHGQDAGSRKAGLRLDERASALRGGKSGLAAVVPGKPDESELLLRVASPHDDERMPPLDSHKERLSSTDIEKLRRWIADGAEYQEHWAFLPPQRPSAAVPAGTNPIDVSIAARRAESAPDLVPTPRAAPETLCRRLFLDLTGLPPTPAEVETFVAASHRDPESALQNLADRLLASPRYGEKWARHWLDVARYADTGGYEKDVPRQQWIWRDWVVAALNADKPYDQFVIEQVAGDLLAAERPHATAAERQALTIATGFVRNSMVSEEGAIIPEQYRKEAIFDRIDALGKAVVGLTLQCAQCHTHKFDPITHDDYFGIFAALNNAYDARSRVYSEEKLAAIDRVRTDIAAAETRWQAAHPDWRDRLERWIAAQAAAATRWEIARPASALWEGGHCHPDLLPDDSVIILGARPGEGEIVFTTEAPLAGVTALRLEALTHDDLEFGGPGRSPEGLFAVSELIVEAQPAGDEKWRKLELASTSAEFETPARPIGAAYRKDGDDPRTEGPSAFLIDGKEITAWRPDRGEARGNADGEVVVSFKTPLAFAAGTKLRARLLLKHGGKDSAGRTNQSLCRFRFSFTRDAEPKASRVPLAHQPALALSAAQRTPEQTAALFTAWHADDPELAELHHEIEACWARYPAPDTSVLHLAERVPEHTRETFLLDRGTWDQPKHPVAPRVPAALHALVRTTAPARLDFARWLVDPRSPTAARVAVNRIWQALFGAGLIDSPEDFGMRASAPAFPEVLDGLAVEFMAGGWSQKKLIRTIVTSATYQQSSVATPAQLERDPRNRWLARGPRFRADAEVIRDVALAASGLLTEKLGGPSVFPPVPESLFSTSFIPVDFWKTATGAERYRRSLYLFRRRSTPDPVLASFDAPNGEFSCAARSRSNTPLAALTSLNEPVFVEAAQALALRILRESGPDERVRAMHAFRLCTSRAPVADEIDAVLELLRSRRPRLADGWLSARDIAFGRDAALPELPAGITPSDVAAWTIAARVLLNLDETLTKN